MDHEKQVSDLVTRTRALFLDNRLEGDLAVPETYDFENEFALSAGNRSWLLWLLAAVFLGLSIVLAWGATWFSDQEIQRFSVVIDQFEDLNLKEVLDTAKRNEDNLARARQNLADRQAALETQRASLRRQAEDELAVLGQSLESDEVKQSRRRSILARRDQALRSADSQAQPELAALQAEVLRWQQAVDQYDSRLSAINREQERVLNQQQSLFDAEKRRLTEYYENRLTALESQHRNALAQRDRASRDLVAAAEARSTEELRRLRALYNPILEDPWAAWARETVDAPEGRAEAAPPAGLTSEGVVEASAWSRRQEDRRAAEGLLERLGRVPYEGDVPQALAQAQARVRRSGAQAEAWLFRAGEILEQRNRSLGEQADLLNRLQAAIETQAQRNRDSGLLVSTGPGEVLAHVSELFSPQPGDTLFVLNSEGGAKARLELLSRDRWWRARVLDRSEELQPFDRLVFQLSEPEPLPPTEEAHDEE